MGLFGGRTRARTWDPMIKSQLSRFADLVVLASLFGVARVVSAPSPRRMCRERCPARESNDCTLNWDARYPYRDGGDFIAGQQGLADRQIDSYKRSF